MVKKRKCIFHKIQILKQNKDNKKLDKHGGVYFEKFIYIL